MAVLDTSIVIAALSPDEQDQTALAKLAPFFLGGGWVPGLWPIEIANVLLTKHRRGILSVGSCEDVWRTIALMPIEVHHFEAGKIASDVRPLALRHGLTSYDACYLQLAIDRATPIATVDRKLIVAARAEGLTVL
jgi:predicted nucleic acid-binding protein